MIFKAIISNIYTLYRYITKFGANDMVNSVSGNYNDWITALNSRGIKTTHLGKGEANFADYTGALSESLKQEIMASFDCDADYDLQAKLAGLYGSKSVMQSGDIVGAAKANGIQVSVQYVKTSYIVDNKADGHYDKDVTNGSIAVYTFKDANGGEIKIADANGNGALETEELFMNELLSGVVSDISASGSGIAGGSAGKQEAVQNNMQNKIDELLAQMQSQLEEQQRHLEEMAAAVQQETLTGLQMQDPAADGVKATETKDSKETDNKDEIKKEAQRAIKEKYPELSDNEIDGYAEAAADKALDTGISIEQAIEAVIGDLEAAA